MVRAIDAASDSPTVFHAVDTSCNRSSDANIFKQPCADY